MIIQEEMAVTGKWKHWAGTKWYYRYILETAPIGSPDGLDMEETEKTTPTFLI